MRHRHHGTYRSRTPKGFVVYKRRPKHPHKLSREHRSIFQKLDRKPYETGGYMDFNKKGLERADVYIGRKASVDIDITPDKEVSWHTHTATKDNILDRINSFPSKEDIKGFKNSPEQTMMVFQKGKLMMATKGKRFRPKNKMLNRLYHGLGRDAERMDISNLFKKYKPKYKRMGLDMQFIKHDKAVKVPIDVIEPMHPAKKSAHHLTFFWKRKGEPDIEEREVMLPDGKTFEEELEEVGGY